MLFDIDGTIIRAGDPAHRAAMEHAMAEVHGTSSTIDGLPLGGRLDRQIVRDALARDGVEPAVVDASLDDLLARTGRRYADLVGPDERRDWLLPGVEATLTALHDGGAVVGVLTGGARGVARHKLMAAGVADLLPIGAYGCEADERSHLVDLARAEAVARGAVVDVVVLVGDTPLDVAAARSAGAAAVAVATGRWTLAELAETGPDVLLADLHHPDGVPPELARLLDG